MAGAVHISMRKLWLISLMCPDKLIPPQLFLVDSWLAMPSAQLLAWLPSLEPRLRRFVPQGLELDC